MNPAGGNWMPIPTGTPVCPRGLEYLTRIDQLRVHQKVERTEAILSFETKNKYTILNTLGQTVYTAKEDSNSLIRNLGGNGRPFDMQIKDHAGNEVIHLIRRFRLGNQKLEVMSPPGTLIGTVVQEWSPMTPKFKVKNQLGNTVFKIKGPIGAFTLSGNVEFQVLSPNKVRIGKITKQWSGFLREAFTDADNFSISFPMDLDVKMKAVLLGALILIDYVRFEK